MQTNKGFTLIELMVVILIIGILSAFALPEYTRAMEKARVTEAITIMDSIRKGVDVYAAENGFETVELIGNTGGSAANQLDINVENELDCNTSDNTCKGKYFIFDSYCSSEHQSCTIIAERMGGAYSLAMNKNANSLKWTRNCVWSGSTENEMGDLICEMLKGQGWKKLSEE